MNNRINPYQNNSLIQTFRQTTQRSEAPARQAATKPQAAPTAAPQAARSVASGQEGLSSVEQQMIDRYFPTSETITMRLYGANRSAETINPGAVGSHLDVQG